MIETYELGKIYEFSNDEKFINRTIGVLVSFGDPDEKRPFEFYPILEEYANDTIYASYCREVEQSYRDYIFCSIVRS
ncbi:MAG: hypothetical protein NC124_02410 [Clostridium sp.]|nr:hypothetical protein [Clostridium sp.]